MKSLRKNIQADKIKQAIQSQDVLSGSKINAEQLKPFQQWLTQQSDKKHAGSGDGHRIMLDGDNAEESLHAAELLAKDARLELHRIDLAKVVSKYIGETEKNLDKIFSEAESKNWTLFFDEADALFGKRTEVKDAHDKYANQEIAYLLQKIEEFKGVVIVAKNRKSNIDDAFMRRFQTVIKFNT